MKFLEMYSTIYNMRIELETFRKPTGSKDNPAMTCKDLYYGHPHLKDGIYITFYSLGFYIEKIDFLLLGYRKMKLMAPKTVFNILLRSFVTSR